MTYGFAFRNASVPGNSMKLGCGATTLRANRVIEPTRQEAGEAP